ncbi:MAG: PAS domain S-box protein [Magnetococcales bacterium]|nr:PAS domain S-box protein [Magnetococcales bacterium]
MTEPKEKPRILIVDDVPMNIKALAEILETDYQILMETSGQKALEAVASLDVDIVLLDVIMPNMDGYEVCEHLKADEMTKDIPVVFVTSKDDPWEEARGLDLGAVDFITKPFRKQIVRARVKTHLELKKQQDFLKDSALQLEQRVKERTQKLQTTIYQLNQRTEELRQSNEVRKQAEEKIRQINVELEERVRERTAKLKESEYRLEMALQGGNLASWDSNLIDGSLVVNHRWGEILGLNLEKCHPNRALWIRCIHQEDRELVLDIGKQYRQGQITVYECEYRIITPLGEVRWVLTKGAAVERDDDGTPVRMAGTMMDVTATKKTEAELQHSLIINKTLIEKAAFGIIMVNTEGTIQVFNPAAEELFGYTSQEVLEQNIRILMPEPYHSAHDSYLANYKKTGKKTLIGITRELPAMMKDGSVFPIELSLREMKIGDEIMFVGLIADITKRKEAETAKEEALLRLEAAIESMDAAFIMYDHNERLVIANSRYLETCPEAAHLIKPGTPYVDILQAICLAKKLHEETGQSVEEWIKERREQRNTHEKGQLVQWNKRWLMVSDHTTSDGGIVSLRYDVTELKQLQDELKIAKDLAESANSSKSDFLSNMSHELRSPMNSIIGFNRRMKKKIDASEIDTDFKKQLLEYIDYALGSSERLLTLLNNILDLSKLESGRVDFKVTEGDLADIVKMAQLEFETQIADKKLEFQLLQQETQSKVELDLGKIMQVLVNLMSNAIKFSPEGGTIKVSLVDTNLTEPNATPIPAIALSVQDQGCGIPPDELEAVFDKFIQSSKTKSGAGGTGLGLAISKEIVQHHSGTIRAENNPNGRGSKFTITLPKCQPRSETTVEC